MPLGDLLRYALLTLVALILLVFGMKWWGKQRTEKEIIAELRTLTSQSSSFEQFNAGDTRKTLFKTLYQLHLAEDKLGMAPDEALDKVFKVRKKGGFMGGTDPDRYEYSNPGEKLVRNSLVSNYEKSNRLGIFTDSTGLEALKKGEPAQIQTGEFLSRWIEITFIIDPKVSPGIEKIVPNLVVGPPAKKETKSPPTAFDIARAKQLASALNNANQLEREALYRIVKHYDEIAKTPESAPAPTTGTGK